MTTQPMNLSNSPYSPGFYDWQKSDSLRSAMNVLPLLLEHYTPASVIDIGCGVQPWLSAFIELGITDVFGVDGEWVPTDRMLVSPSRFQAIDLNNPKLDTPRTFDLAITLEVAEHLEVRSSRRFVEFICSLADVVLFSAAIPGQGGKHHINEQWPSFWAGLFQDADYSAYDFIRQQIWDNSDIAWWYRQNIVVFAKNNTAISSKLPHKRTPAQLDIVHPLHYQGILKRATHPKLSKIIKQIPGAISRDIDRKILKRKRP